MGGTLRRRLRTMPRAACTAGYSLVRQRVVRTASLPASVLLLFTACGLPCATFMVAFFITDRRNPEVWTRKGYFLSAAIDLPPASNFGSLGLTLTLAAFAAVAVVRHHIVAERLRAAALTAVLGDLHRASLFFALASTLGGHGVAAIPHNQNQAGHNTFAAVFVLCGLKHFHLESRIERAAYLSSKFARCSRLALVCIATVGCATFLSHVVVEEMFHRSIGIGKLFAAGAEIISVGCFVVYLATYSRSFHESQITLTVTVPTATPPAPPSKPLSPPASPPPVARQALPPQELPQLRGAAADLNDSPLRMRRCRSAGDAVGAVGQAAMCCW